MNHFTFDDRYFAKHYTQYGVIPTDKELPYKASENSACGKYVHPDDDNNGNKKHNMKKRIKLTESQLNRVVKESVRKTLSENIDAHLGIDDICNLLGGGDRGYDTLNKILWSLQEQGVIDFNEDALDRLYNSPNY